MAEQVYLIEDDDNIRELVCVALSAYSYDVKAFVCAEDAFASLRKNLPRIPDIFLFDIMLPGMDGLTAVKEIRQNPEISHLPILMLTAKSSEIEKVVGLENGADDYLAKPFGIMELVARIKALLRRMDRMSPKQEETESELIKTGDIIINTALREVSYNEKMLELTLKEYDLLMLLIMNKNKIVSREEILDKVWGSDFLGETRTLDMHIGTLRKKLEDDAEKPTLIKTVRGIGYRFIG